MTSETVGSGQYTVHGLAATFDELKQDWFEGIDLGRFNIHSPTDCTLGQMFSTWAGRARHHSLHDVADWMSGPSTGHSCASYGSRSGYIFALRCRAFASLQPKLAEAIRAAASSSPWIFSGGPANTEWKDEIRARQEAAAVS